MHVFAFWFHTVPGGLPGGRRAATGRRRGRRRQRATLLAKMKMSLGLAPPPPSHHFLFFISFFFFLFKWLFLIKRLFCHEYAIHVLCISSNTEPTSQSARSRFSFSQKKKTLNYLSSNLVYYEKPRLKKTQKNRVR